MAVNVITLCVNSAKWFAWVGQDWCHLILLLQHMCVELGQWSELDSYDVQGGFLSSIIKLVPDWHSFVGLIWKEVVSVSISGITHCQASIAASY